MIGNKRSCSLATSIVFAGLLLAATAHAADREARDCDAWTFLPDFRCEHRDARPDDAFNPVGMPYLFEDPYITSNLNFAYIYHELPNGPVFDGGSAHILALQIRLALTERIAFIATKDGLTMLRPGSGSAVDEDTGIFDMTVGFKFSLFETEARDFIISPAIRYEIPMGSEKLFQGYGDGVFIPSASFRWGLDRLGLAGANVVGSLGGQLPVDGSANSTSIFYNLHLDYGIEIEDSFVRYVVPFIEFNGIHYTDGGDGTNPVHVTSQYGGGTLPLNTAQAALMTGPFEGFDVANLGSRGVAGADVLVMGGGVRIPTTWGVSFGLMYEGPLTDQQDIHDQRFTFMATWEL